MNFFTSLNKSTFSKISPRRLSYHLQGIDGIEIALFDDSYVEYLNDLRNYFHGDFLFHATTNDIKLLKNYWIPLYKGFSNFSGNITIHPLSTLEATTAMLNRLNKIPGVTFCVENLNTLNSKKRLNKEILQSKNYKAKTFDIGHLVFDYPETNTYEILNHFTNSVKNVHIHDLEDTIDHMPLSNAINYKQILSNLNKNNFKGNLIFEMHVGYYKGDTIEEKLYYYIAQIKKLKEATLCPHK